MTNHAPIFLTSERHYTLGETPARIGYQPRHSLAAASTPPPVTLTLPLILNLQQTSCCFHKYFSLFKPTKQLVMEIS